MSRPARFHRRNTAIEPSMPNADTTTPTEPTRASAGESASYLGHVCGKALGQRSWCSTRSRRPLDLEHPATDATEQPAEIGD